MNTKIKPIVSWSIWGVGLSVVMGIITRKHLVTGFREDGTGMSIVIAALFAAGLIISFLAALKLHSEWGILESIKKSGKIPKSKGSEDLAGVFSRLKEYKKNGEVVNVNAAIDTYHSKHNSRVRSVSIMAAIVISMGLLGTVLGLIMSISGLSGMVDAIGSAKGAMLMAMKETFAGMGTAFYTTFFGAFGGLILRAVAVSQLNSLSELCATAAEYAENHLAARLENKDQDLNQQVAKIVQSFDGMQKEIETITTRMHESFEETMKGFGGVLAEAGNHAMDATKECISGMTGEMNSFTGTISDSIGTFNTNVVQAGEDIRAAIGTVNSTIEGSGTELTEAFGGLNRTLDDAGAGITDSFEGLNKTIGKSGGSLSESFDGLNETIGKAGLTESFEGLTQNIDKAGASVTGSFDSLNGNIAKSGEGVTEAFGGLNENISKAGEGVTESFEGMNEKIGKSGEGVSEAFEGMNEKIGKAGESVTATFDSLDGNVKEAGENMGTTLEDFRLTIKGTSIELHEAVGELHGAIGQATGEMVTMAKAKLDSEAVEIAGHLSVAADSIQKFMQSKTPKSSDQNESEEVA